MSNFFLNNQECPFCFSHFFSLLLFRSLSHLHKAVQILSLYSHIIYPFSSVLTLEFIMDILQDHFAKLFVLID